MVDKKGSLYQIVYPSCDLDKLCVFAGANVFENQNERILDVGKYNERAILLHPMLFIIPYLENKGKIDIHQYRSRTWLQ